MIFNPINILLSGVLLILFLSCKKDNDDMEIPATGSKAEKMLDSLYLYAKETYLWHQSLPTYQQFSPRNYHQHVNNFLNMQQALTGIAAFSYTTIGESPKEFRNGSNIPVYSFITQRNANATASVLNQETPMATGIGIDFLYTGESGYFVSRVDIGSPAHYAGISRGMRLMSVNGENAGDHNLFQNDRSLYKFRTDNGNTISVNLQSATYFSTPIRRSAVWIRNGQKIGYIAFSTFGKLDESRNYIDSVFIHFSNENIHSLIVDLRANTGGYISTMEYLANQIAPASLEGKIMYSEHFNELMQHRQATILKTIPYLNENGETVYVNGRPANFGDIDFSVNANTARFNTRGKLNISKIVFVVNGFTASASEVLINSFTPHMTVKLAGQKTYGKPVGFFGINIDAYTVYLSQFIVKNARGEADYFNGMEVDIPAGDDPGKDWGDPGEEVLSKVIEYLTTGQVSTSRPAKIKIKQQNYYSDKFIGMIKETFKQ